MSFNNKRITAVIPARMSSGRFPGKPLAKINGREMVLMVADIVKQSKFIDEILIATEDDIICDLVDKSGYKGVITGKHYTCTHRISCSVQRHVLRHRPGTRQAVRRPTGL